jgi:hypothetical protein
MGHLVNPLSFRLGITSFWKSNYVSYFNSKYKYSILYFYDKILYSFLEWLFSYRWAASFFLKKFKKGSIRRIFFRKRLKRIGSRRRFLRRRLRSFFKKLWVYFSFSNPYLKTLLVRKKILKKYRRKLKLRKFLIYHGDLLKRKIKRKGAWFQKCFISRFIRRKNGSVLKVFYRRINKGLPKRRVRRFKYQIRRIRGKRVRVKINFKVKSGPKIIIKRRKRRLYIKRLLFFKGRLFRLFFRHKLRLFKLFFLRFRLFKSYRRKRNKRLFFFLRRYFLPELSHIVMYRNGMKCSKVLLYFSNPVLYNVLAFKKLKRKLSWKRKLKLKKRKFIKNLAYILKFNDRFNLKYIYFFFFKILLILFIFFPFFLYVNRKKHFLFNLKLSLFALKRKFFKKVARRISKIISKNSLSLFFYYIKFKRFFFFPFLNRREHKRSLFFLSNFSFLFVKRFFESRWLFFVKAFVKKFLVNFKLNFNVYFVSFNVMTSRMLFNFFCRHLRRKKPLNRILNMILWDIKRQRMLVGFKILTAGRFTRKERALYKWMVHKKTPLSLYASNLDYFSGFFKSRFGVSSFKIWIFKK